MISSSSYYENAGDSNYSNFETSYGNNNEPRDQVVPSRTRIFLGRVADDPSGDTNSGQYSPTSNYKTNNDGPGYSSNNDEMAVAESTHKEPKIIKRFFRASPVHNSGFSDEDEEEETLNLVEYFKIESLVCLQCENEFVDQASLKKHLLDKHNTGPFVCPLQLCPKSFESR